MTRNFITTYAETGKLSDEPNIQAYEALNIDHEEGIEIIGVVLAAINQY